MSKVFIETHQRWVRLTRRVPLVEQELLTLPEHINSPYMIYCKKSFKIPKESSESLIRRRTDYTMAKGKRLKGQKTMSKTYT
jgi:hypothetical protein